MKEMKATLRLALVALLSFVLCNRARADAPDNVQGDWTIYSTSIKNGATVVKHVQIAQYGNRITGYFEGPDQSGPIQGRVNDHHIVFSTVTRTVITFRGQIYGDNMSGSYGIHGQHAPWQAVRPAAPVGAAPPATGTVYASQPVLVPPPPPAPAPPQPVSQATTDSAATGSYAPASGDSAPTPAPLSSDQLNSLVAPIALYPDALVAQVLGAATNPDQVAYADDWLGQNKNLTGAALAQAVDQQSWDPSVKALTQFPSVLDNLAHNLSWTSSLGQAFANQQADVMAAVQAMRAKAQAAGTLQSTSQITVTQPAPNTIVIQPASPQVVFVPVYNPTVVYGAPVVVPFYVPPPMPVASVRLYFGTGVVIGGAYGGGWGGGFGWGWHAWNVHWGCCGGGRGSTTIIYNHTTYINNHITNNRNYNGYRPSAGGAVGSQNHAWYGNNGTFHPDGNYKPGQDTHYGPNGAYHPNGYFGPDGGWHADKGTSPSNTPNGGNNGNHGLIGGNGGVEHAAAGSNAGAHPVIGAGPSNTPNGGNNGTHGLIGGNGGVEHAAAGSNAGAHPVTGAGPSNTPNGGNNGNRGLIGSNGGVQRDQQSGGQSFGQNRSDNNRMGAGQNRSRIGGDGAANRAENNQGRRSMGGARPQRQAREHASEPHRK